MGYFAQITDSVIFHYGFQSCWDSKSEAWASSDLQNKDFLMLIALSKQFLLNLLSTFNNENEKASCSVLLR